MTNGTKGDENNMKSRKVILPLIICLSLILSTFNPVFAKSLEDYDIETLNAESMQEDYGLSLMAEASGVDETLPTWSTNPTWEPINSDLNNESRYTVLMKILESTGSGDRYVRLNTDISVSGDYGYGIAVKGKKVLDLNGHKLSIKLGKGEGYSGRQTAISISSGATLMIIDSKGGGKIFGDTWICDPVDMGYNRAATDLIYNKGTLIIHMPNGEIETGRSKKQWVTAAAEDGEYPDIAYARYSGYIRGQANGTAIIGTKNSKTVLVSGRVIGRGFYKFGTDAWNHDTPSEKCAAIETKGKFIMYGGEILGSGGAGALRAYGGKNNTIVYSGKFRVKSLDKMAIAAYKAYTPRPNFTKECGYGYPISGERNFAIGSEIIVGDHETTVRPKSETKTTSDTVRLTHSYGTSIIDLEKQSMWVVYAYYTPYFLQSGRNYLGYSENPTGYDYNVPTFWKATAKFTVLNHIGKEIGYYNESSWQRDDDDKSIFRCDVLACKDKKGNPIAWENRLTYTLRCTITETWGGDPEQTRTVYQDLNFRFWDSETQQTAKNLTFDFIPTKTATGEPTNYIIALNDSYVNAVKDSRVSEMTVNYRYYEPKKNNKGEITGFEKKPEETLVYSESILDNDGTNYFPSKKVVLKPKTAGPIEVSIDLFTASGVKIETKTYKIFAMPALTARFLSNEEYAVPSDGYTMTPQFSTWKVSMNSGIADFGKMTAYSISPSAVMWQYYDGETKKFVDISSSDTRFVFADNGNVLETNRTGEYRASYTFEGARYYSPRTIFMNGTNFSNTRAPYISGPATTEYGDKATLTVKLNDNADWPAVSEYTLICRGQPSGARISNSSVSNTTGKFTIDELFFNKAVTKENFVPGEYTFEAKVRHADGVATSRRFVLTYEKTNIDYVFLVNGEQAEFNDATGESRYTLPTDCNGTFNVENGLYPRDSTKLKYPEKDYTYSIKNLTPETITFADGTATVLSPGDAKLNLEISKKSDGSVVQTVPLTVTIPIIGFEVSQPDYNAYLGQKWEDVRADVKSVWGPGERKVTTGTDKYLTVSTKSLNGAGLYDTVDYNGKADITWTAKPNTGYRFAMKILESGYNTNGKKEYTMCADVYSIQTNDFTDTVKTAREHNIYGANSSKDFYYYTEGEPDGDDTRNPTNAKIYLTSKNAHMKDPNVQYIDVVSITTSNPAVGDLRYEGTDPDKYYNEFMNVEIGTLSGVLNTDGNPIITAQTHVSKLDTVTGSGKPYDNAEDEPMGDYWQITNIVNGVANKPTQRYETGMDDFYLISDSKEYLQDCLKKITAYLSTLHLTLNDKTEIVSISKGIRFLGFHTYITEDGKIIRRLTGENKRAIKKRLRKYYKLVVCGKMTRKEFNEKYQSWRNHASHGNCIKLLCDMDDYVAAMFGEDKMEKRIIIAGSRSFNDYSYFENWLAVYLKQFKDKQIKIISGGATGADKFAERYAKEHNIPLRLFYAKWEKYGKGAGYIRNSDMLEYAVKSDDNCLISVSLQGPFLALCVNGSGKKSRK